MNKQYVVTLMVMVRYGLVVLMLGLTSPVFAQPYVVAPTVNADPVITDEIKARIYARLAQARPDLDPSNLRPSDMPTLYKIDLNGQLAFVSKDGEFLIAGEMYRVEPDRLVNLQEQERRQQEQDFEPKRAEMLAAIDKKDMVIYSPEKAVKGHIYVFTDIDCGFCRRLHSQMDEMLDQGIEVRYLAFPRAGPTSSSAQKLATTWCSSNPQELMDRYKTGQRVTTAVCDVNPVAEHYMLGQELGVRGTPAIVLESGQMIPGAVSPGMLVKEMGI